ncbi:unnamed protein product, partial [Brassica rapa]
QPTWAKITQTVHGKGQRADPRGPKSPKQSTGRASVLSPRTSVLICTATDVLCVLTDTHGRSVCADGHPRMSCVTPTKVLCVLNRQPTWAKITRTFHGKGQRADPRGPKSPKQSTGWASVLSTRTSMLICVLIDSHGRPVWADRHTRTHMDVLCVTPTNVLCVLNRQPTWAKITQRVHGEGQRAESKDQRADMCTDGQPRMSSTDVLCVLTDTDGHTRTATHVLCVLTDTHGRPVCAKGHPQTSCVS